jgi:hypothetical protein
VWLVSPLEGRKDLLVCRAPSRRDDVLTLRQSILSHLCGETPTHVPIVVLFGGSIFIRPTSQGKNREISSDFRRNDQKQGLLGNPAFYILVVDAPQIEVAGSNRGRGSKPIMNKRHHSCTGPFPAHPRKKSCAAGGGMGRSVTPLKPDHYPNPPCQSR